MADLEAHAASAHISASSRKEPREGVVEVPGYKPPREATTTQPSLAPDTSRLRAAAKASSGPPPVEKGADVLVAQGAIYDV
jgi:hypothetical protein